MSTRRIVQVRRALTVGFFASTFVLSTEALAKRGHTCAPGQVDYGSGMVAHSLPREVQRDVAALVHCLEQQHSDAFLSRQLIDPSAPHLSILYGVNNEEVWRLRHQVDRVWPAKRKISLSFGDPVYWDDAKRQKSVLVLRVQDKAAALTSLHRSLRGKRLGEEAHPFTPHVTLAHLRYKARLSFDACDPFWRALSKSVWGACEFVATNACGEVVWHRACDAK